MAYIGKEPSVGNFIKLDAITCSSTNTYNLLYSSVAFTPESVNHMLVSLNGVIQAPTTAYTVAGSAITFIPASGTLSSSDTIDFIMVYGNVLDIGTPSDNTVSTAKIVADAVNGSKIADDSIDSEHIVDGSVDLAHMSSQSVDEDNLHISNAGTNGQFLSKQSGNAGGLTWADAGGGAWDLVSAVSITGDISTISSDAFSASYNNYKVYVYGLKINGSTNNLAMLRVRTSSGDFTSSTYKVSANGQYLASGSSSFHNAGQWNVNALDLNGWNLPDDDNWSNSATRDFIFHFYNTNSTTRYKNLWFDYGGADETSAKMHTMQGRGHVETTSALTGFKLYSSAGTAFENEGKVLIFGLKES